MNERTKSLLLNKNAYYLNYFIKDIKGLISDIIDANLINVGTTMRMVVKFSCKNKYEYFALKKKLREEDNFLNGILHSGVYCASFVADKKHNETLDMVRRCKDFGILPKDKIFDFVKHL